MLQTETGLFKSCYEKRYVIEQEIVSIFLEKQPYTFSMALIRNYHKVSGLSSANLLSYSLEVRSVKWVLLG